MATGANPVLKHYTITNNTAGAFAAVVAAVPAGRALVISKLVLAINNTAGQTLVNYITLGTGTTDLYRIANGISLAPGEQWTETGLLVLATELVQWAVTNTASASVGANVATLHVFGEEVDN